MLANAWQYAPPVDPVGSDGGISDPLRFVTPAAAEEAYLVTDLGNVFRVEDNDPGNAPINNQNQANHTDAIGLALGQAIVGSGMYLKSVKTPAEHTLVYHGDGQVATVPLVPYTKLPNDADFAMVYPSGQDIIEINVTRFDAGYSRYDSYTQALVQNPPYYSEAFSHTDTIRSHGTNMTLYSLSPSLYGNAVYMTTNATNPDFSVTFGTSDMDLIMEWVYGKGYFLYHSEGNVTDENPTYRRSSGKWYWSKYASIDLSPPPGTWFATSGSENLYANASETELYTVSSWPKRGGVCFNSESNRTNTVQLDPGIHTSREKRFVVSATDDANGTSISSSLSAYERYERRSVSGCSGRYTTYTFYSANATLDMWDRGFRHDPILQVNGTGGHLFTVPYTNDWPLYMIAGPTSEPVGINMIWFDPASDRFSVGGLPRNVPYVISDNDGNDVAAGVTSGSGSISRTLGSISGDMVPGDGGVLRLYPGAPHYDGYINVVSFDMRNGARVDSFHGSDSTFAYVPVIYARLAFIADAQVDHVTLNSKILGDINMDHLAGSYLKNQALMVPILPGATALDLTINGFDLSVLVSDMRVEEGPGFIVKETNSHEVNARGGRVYASSAATSNSFAIATSNGTMTADVTVWLTGEAEMSLDTTYEIGVDRNKDITHFYNSNFAVVNAWFHSLYHWWIKGDPDESRDFAASRMSGYPPLSEIREDQRLAQWEINRNYRDSVEQNLESTRSPAIEAVVTVYKNGELVKTVSLTGAGLPVTTTAHSVSGLPTMYWPQGTITSVHEDNGDPRHNSNRRATYDALAAITIHQEADISYQSSTPQALIEVDVDTGDMVGFVVQAQLATSAIAAPPLIDYTVDPRLHVNSTSIASTGHGEATVTIEGGSIDIFCCSE